MLFVVIASDRKRFTVLVNILKKKKRHPMMPTCVQMNISQTGFFTAIRGFKMTFCMTANIDSPTVRPPLNTLHSI